MLGHKVTQADRLFINNNPCSPWFLNPLSCFVVNPFKARFVVFIFGLVLPVLCRRAKAQVTNSVVALVAIDMVDFHTFWNTAFRYHPNYSVETNTLTQRADHVVTTIVNINWVFPSLCCT